MPGFKLKTGVKCFCDSEKHGGQLLVWKHFSFKILALGKLFQSELFHSIFFKNLSSSISHKKL